MQLFIGESIGFDFRVAPGYLARVPEKMKCLVGDNPN
jgi:hypothetical protein